MTQKPIEPLPIAVKRRRRNIKAGPAELRVFLRRLPVIESEHNHPVEIPRPKEARTWKGPRNPNRKAKGHHSQKMVGN